LLTKQLEDEEYERQETRYAEVREQRHDHVVRPMAAETNSDTACLYKYVQGDEVGA